MPFAVLGPQVLSQLERSEEQFKSLTEKRKIVEADKDKLQKVGACVGESLACRCTVRKRMVPYSVVQVPHCAAFAVLCV